MNALKRLFPYLRPYRTAILLGALIVIVNNAIGALEPWLLKLAVDSLSNQGSWAVVGKYAALIVAVALSAGVLRFYLRKVLIGVSRHVELDLRNAVFAQLQRLPASFYNRHRTGDIMARMTSDLEAVRSVLGPGIMYPMDTISMAAFALVMMLILSPMLTLMVFISAPLISLTVFYLGRLTFKLHTRIQEQFSALSDRAQENLAGVRVVRSFAQEERELRDFDLLHREYVVRNLKMAKAQALFMPVLGLMFEIGTALILLYGGRGIINGHLTLGDFVAFVGYLSMLAWPIIAVGWVANLFQRGAASMKRISEVLDAVPDIQPPRNPQLPHTARGEIVFDHATFAYGENAPALTDLDFTIPAGKTVAIVGRTGSGKSTLVSLIPRLFDPTGGHVLIDGIPTTEWDLRALRDMVGVVPQDALLFSDTLRANISFGVEHVADERFEETAEISQISKDVKDFPRGFDTMVGERGLSLSGGQKGRTALARALLKDPKILILDDSLAAVDTQTEEQILEGLRRFMVGRTSIIISHRVSTVKHADEIIVLDQGAVIERGSHRELLANGGYYAELDRMQRLEAELEELETEPQP
ncbi:MAG TPA: ABC transporter ATP-binding protein [bacterium]|jgi:ATP-binding cassette subfamily B protein